MKAFKFNSYADLKQWSQSLKTDNSDNNIKQQPHTELVRWLVNTIQLQKLQTNTRLFKE